MNQSSILIIPGAILFVLIILTVTGITYLKGALFAVNPEGADSKQLPVITKADDGLRLQFIRHGTFVLTIEGKKIVVDPMLAKPGEMAPIPFTTPRVRNPLLPLPVETSELLKDADAVLLTHYHLDHFDKAAETIIPKTMKIFCQIADEAKLHKKGFTNTHPIHEDTSWEGLTIVRRSVNHTNNSSITLLLGTSSSSYLIKGKGKTLFITGDTIYDNNLVTILNELKPDFITANMGSARFLWGNPITLTGESLLKIKESLPEVKIIPIHMNAINHCREKREQLQNLTAKTGLAEDIIIPNEGDTITLE